MKRIKVLGIAAFVLLLLCVFAGCSDESSSPAKMVFSDNTKEFTIDEDLGFSVSFKPGCPPLTFPNPMDPSKNIEIILENKKVSGTINSQNKWDNDTVTGTIKTIDSNDPAVKGGLGVAIGTPLTLTYTKDNSGAITKVAIDFLGNLAGLAQLAQLLEPYADGTSTPDQAALANIVPLLVSNNFLAQADAQNQQEIITAMQAAGTAINENAQLQLLGICQLVIGGTFDIKK